MSKNELQTALFGDFTRQSLYQAALDAGQIYLENAEQRHIYPTQQALEDLKVFKEELPLEMENSQEVLELLIKFGGPATINQIGGRYFGFVNGSVIPVGLAAKLLASFWDQNAAMAATSPLVATLEGVVESWLKTLFGLPERTCAGFVTGTSIANLCGLAAGRFRILKNLGWDIQENGLSGAPPIRIITGKEAHSSVIKALKLLGFGMAQIERVQVDEQGRIVPEAMPDLDKNCLVILQAGNVNSGSFDPIETICTNARAANAWIHVDGAFGLWAATSNALKHLTKGLELANSFAVDGHKTLNTPYDSGIVMCTDREALVTAMHASGSYFVISESRDGMFYTADMSRRSRIIELWAILKYLGRSGIDQLVTLLHNRAVQFAQATRRLKGFEVLNEVVFNQVVVACQTDALTERVMQRVQEDRICWVGGSTWKGRQVIRVSVCSWATTHADIERSVTAFKDALEQIEKA